MRLLLICVDTNLAGTWYMYLLVLSQSKVNCSLMAKEMLGWFWWNCAQEYFLPHLCCGNKATGIISLEMLILVLGYWSRCGFPVLIFSHCGHSKKTPKTKLWKILAYPIGGQCTHLSLPEEDPGLHKLQLPVSCSVGCSPRKQDQTKRLTTFY